MKFKKKRTFTKDFHGFSLVELLVVIAIIAVLAAILIPTIRAVKDNSSRSLSASNLRHLGSAITLYSQDHQSTLPGPLYSKQKPRYKELIVDKDGKRTQELPSLVATYCDLPLDGSEWRDFPLLSSPLFEGERINNATYSYAMQQKSSDSDSTPPWGKENSKVSSPPMTMAQVASRVDPSYWAIQALDAGNIPAGSSATNTLPKPLFADARATLYFDWHVEFTPID